MPRRRIGTRALTAAVLVVWSSVAGALTGCTDGDGEDGTATSVPDADTVLRVASVPWPSCLNPVTCRDDAARDLVWEHVLPRLMVVDASGAYRPSSVLAGFPRIEPLADGRSQVTFRLRSGTRWRDGRPMTSSDVVASWMAWRDTPAADRTHTGHIVGVDDRDPEVAVVTLDQAYADWPELFGGFSGWLLQADALGADTDVTGEWEDDLPFGVGPFDLVSFGPDRIDLAAPEDARDVGSAPAVDLVEITRTAAGDRPEWPADATVLVPAPTTPVPDGYTAVPTDSDSVVGILFDQRTPALADPFVRVAVDRLIDRDTMAEVLVAAGRPAPAPPRCAGWLPRQARCAAVAGEPSPVDLAGARAALEAGAWTPGPDGTRSRGGQRLEVPVSSLAGQVREASVASAVRVALRAVGVTGLDAELAPSWSDPARTEPTGMSVVAVELGTVDRLADLYGCTAGGVNPLGWCDPEVQVWLGQLGSTTDVPTAENLSASILTRAAQQIVWLPLASVASVAFVAPGSVVPEERPVGGGPLALLAGWQPPEE